MDMQAILIPIAPHGAGCRKVLFHMGFLMFFESVPSPSPLHASPLRSAGAPSPFNIHDRQHLNSRWDYKAAHQYRSIVQPNACPCLPSCSSLPSSCSSHCPLAPGGRPLAPGGRPWAAMGACDTTYRSKGTTPITNACSLVSLPESGIRHQCPQHSKRWATRGAIPIVIVYSLLYALY